MRETVAGIPFPDYLVRFAAKASGQRTDHAGGRTERTVYYRLATGARVSYTIVSGTPLALPRGVQQTIIITGVAIRAYASAGLHYVTLVRNGRTCVLAGNVGGPTLVALAARPLTASL